MDKPIRILYVGNHPGFFLSHRLPVMKGLQDRGYEIHLAVPTRLDELDTMIENDPIERIQEMGFVIHPVIMARGKVNPITELRSFWALFQIYRKVQPDLVYHNTIKPVLYGGIIARLTGTPAVISLITGLGYVFISQTWRTYFLRFFVQWVYWIALGHPNIRVIFQNTDDKNSFVGQNLIAEQQTDVIKGAGVDMARYHPTPEPEGTPIVMVASRLLWDKGIGEFIQAAKTIQESGIEARFWLVGDTDTANPNHIPREQIQAWQDEGIIEWLGWRRDIPNILRQSHVVCLPSYREGLPKVLVEAAATGRPIITTNVPGCREIVQDGVNGFLVEARNTESLTEAIKKLLLDASLRQQMGFRGRELVEKEASQEFIVSRTIEACERLLRKNN